MSELLRNSNLTYSFFRHCFNSAHDDDSRVSTSWILNRLPTQAMRPCSDQCYLGIRDSNCERNGVLRVETVYSSRSCLSKCVVSCD